MTDDDYAKFVEDWPRRHDPMDKRGRSRFTMNDVRQFVRGACDLIAEDIRAGMVSQEKPPTNTEEKEKATP